MSVESSPLHRKSLQRIAPQRQTTAPGAHYCLYPTFPVPNGSVEIGFEALAQKLRGHGLVRIDGVVGVDWPALRSRLSAALAKLGHSATWIDIATALKPEADIDALVAPFLGGDDPLFGTRCTGELRDFFSATKMASMGHEPNAGLTVVYGCGAGLVAGEGPLVYVELPKNEVQYRSRAAQVQSLGEAAPPASPQQQYKRFYFVDWPVLRRHQAAILPQVDWFVDEQAPESPTFIAGSGLREALGRMSRSVFRPRPWFEAGPWGGQWLKRQLPELPQDEPNYAWSFELISPENGLAFSDGQHQCEVSFDWLMNSDAPAVLGEHAERFGAEFPIRFDFLDTIEGGNLSVQCHPRPEYVRAQFGESFTQDETYYIVTCQPGAEVYLGFQAGIDRAEFREELERSFQTGSHLDVPRFVQTLPAHAHDLFLIPSGTIHCSGAGNLVLEISATPYIFTFKMYDWQRLGLDGKPRPLNIARAFENLRFERQGALVERELVSHPQVIEEGADWRLVHLPTHAEHFYDVHRFEFASEVATFTEGSPHVLMLVEGSRIEIQTASGMLASFNSLETFVVPAAASSYKLINRGETPAKVVKAFLKPLL